MTLANIKDLHDKDRNIKLYNLLKTSLEKKLDFKKNPIYLSKKDEEKNRPIKKVTLASTQKSGFEFTNIKAIADNATMLRADIFENKGKYYAVPIYLHEITLEQAPNISTNGKDVSKEGFNFKFSLYKNDLIKVNVNKEEIYLYYNTTDVSRNTFTLKTHDSNYRNFSEKDKIRLAFQNFKTFEKYTVDILGNKFKVKSEQRKWFKLKKSKDENLDKVVKDGELEKIE